MSTTLLTSVQTQGGEAVTVMTKSHLLYLFKLPRTNLMPLAVGNVGSRGIQFHWTTGDPAVLASLHDLLIQALRQVTLAELRGIADLGKHLLMLGLPFIPEDAPLPDSLKRISGYVKRVV